MSGGKPAAEPTRRLRHRRLTTDEEHLWSLVVRSIKPLRHSKRQVMAASNKAGIRDAARPAEKKAAGDLEAAALRQRTPSRLTPITGRERRRLARGRAVIDARIDLHGMTQAEAHVALRRFLHRHQADGANFVLVITGKGPPNAARGERGVLRQQVPVWLTLPEFRRYVLGFDIAQRGHGGEGALYVRLRKVRL